MEETFAQIAGAAEHSLPDVNVDITPEGSIVGQGVTASGGAIEICGGNLDKILQSFGGIEGGNSSVGGKALSLLNHVGVLGGAVGGVVESALTDIQQCINKLHKVIEDAEKSGNNSVVLEAQQKIHDLESGVAGALAAAKVSMEGFHSSLSKSKDAVTVLGQKGGVTSTAGMMSLAFSELNKLKGVADHIKDVAKQAHDMKQVVEHLARKAGGSEDVPEDVVDGGLSTNGLADRLLKHRQEIQKVVNEFIKEFGSEINTMVKSIDGMAADLGKRIDYDEKTYVFLETFNRIKEFMSKPERAKFYQYLLELNQEQVINSKEVKDRFLSLIRDLGERANAMDATGATKEFAKSCADVISVVNKYSDKMKSFRDDLKKSGGSTETMNELFSVDASRINVSALVNPLDNLDIAVKKIEFFRRIAVFRSNLHKTNKEIELYSKDYAKSVGKAIGEAITKIQTEYTEIINSISDNKTGMGLEIDMYNESQPSDQKISKEKLKMIYKWQCDARVGLYKTVEAIDMYLLHFTEAVTKNPDAVADLQKLLTATSIIAKWYDTKAGDNLIRVFEMLATDVNANVITDDVLDRSDFSTTLYNTGNADPSVNLDGKLGGDRANKLYERCRRAVEGVVVLKNIISYFITISEKYGNFKGERNIYMAPSNIYKNLVNYIWVSALATQTTGTDMLTETNELKRIITYEDTKVNIAKVENIDPETMGINFSRHSIDKLRLLKCHSELVRLKDFISTLEPEQFPRLKQYIIGVFARLGKTDYIFEMIKFGVYDITVMETDQLKRFFEYLTYVRPLPALPPRIIVEYNGLLPNAPAGAAVAQQQVELDRVNNVDALATVISRLSKDEKKNVRLGVIINGGITFSTFMPIHEFSQLSAVDVNDRNDRFLMLNINRNRGQNNMNSGFLNGLMRGLTNSENTVINISFTKRAIAALEYIMSQMMATFKKNTSATVFAIDDTYFVLTIKAIAGKIMAVTGINSMYKHPTAVHNTLTQSQTRLIMGGSNGDVDIIDDAVELYVRLPLLVEFYRHIFDNGNKEFKAESVQDNMDNEQISLVPEIGNVWSGLLINIFDKAKHIDAGLYTQENMQKIVSEVNSIYKHFKGSVPNDELIRHVMTELVAEINRRYGVIKRQELQNYFRVVNAIKKNDVTIDESNYTNNDFDILNEAMEFEEKAPSDEYVQKLKDTLNDTTVSKEVKINKLTDYKIVKDFRERLSAQLTNMQNAQGDPPVSLRDRIRFLKKAITTKSSRSEKYDMIIKAIEESHNINQASNDIFMCFHEFVIMPLRTLKQMHSALEMFILHTYLLMCSAKASNIPGVNFSIISDTMYENMKQLFGANNGILFNGQALRLNHPQLLTGANIRNVNDPLDLPPLANNQEQQELALLLMELILQFSTNAGDLVKLNITTSKRITLDLSEYQKVCEYLVANVKYMVDKFTGLVPTAVLDLVTGSNNIDEKGTIYYLEKSLLHKMFNKQNKGETSRDIMSFDNLYKFMPVVSDIIFRQSLASDTLLQKVILHDPAGGITDTSAVTCMPFIRDAFMQYNKQSGGYVTAPGRATFVYDLLFSPIRSATIKDDTPRGLMQDFNKIVAQYINGLYDQQSRKIYTRTFYTFASSALIDALNGQSFKDFTYINAAAIVGYDAPANQTVLSATLAYAMKVLINRTNPITGVKLHEIATFQEIAPHMLEKYRMLIPMFLRIANAFIRRCRHYRKMIGYVTVTGNISPVLNNGMQNANTNFKENISDAEMAFTQVWASLSGSNAQIAQNTMVLYIDEMANAMTSLVQDMEAVQKELLETDSTITLYFDVKRDFTKNYVHSNQDLPFAPLSILAMAYPKTDSRAPAPAAPVPAPPVNPGANTNDQVIPLYDAGDIVSSKFLYGLRTMLVDNFKLTTEKVPYLKKLIDDFNGYSTSGNKIDVGKFNDVLKYVGMANNFIYDLRFYNGTALTYLDLLRDSFPSNTEVATYQELQPKNAAMSLIETINVVDSVNTVSEFVKGHSVANDRIRVFENLDLAGANPRGRVMLVNILDLQIMPINVHSLMREIPLANLYNYAMTFDAVISQLHTDGKITELIKELLTKPYSMVVNDAAVGPAINIGGNLTAINTLADNNNNLRFIKDIVFERIANTGRNALTNAEMTSRLNTKILRNLMFLTLVQHAIKQKVKKEIEFINTRVVSNVAAVSNVITDATVDGQNITESLFEF